MATEYKTTLLITHLSPPSSAPEKEREILREGSERERGEEKRGREGDWGGWEVRRVRDIEKPHSTTLTNDKEKRVHNENKTASCYESRIGTLEPAM